MFIPDMQPRLNLVISKGNKIISDTDVEAHSFVRNWYVKIAQQTCFVNARSAMNFNIINTSNTSVNSDTTCRGYATLTTSHYIPGAGVDDFGLLVGDSDTAWAFTDYALSSLIASGSGAGELGYAAQSATAVSDTDDTRTITLTRAFNNNSGGEVTVREIGWATCGYNGSNYNSYYLQFREVLGSPIVLSDSEQLTVNFMIDLTYPEAIS